MSYNKTGNFTKKTTKPKNNFTLIPNELIFTDKFNKHEKLILFYFLALPETAYINYETISTILGLSLKTVEKTCKELQEKKILTIIKSERKHGFFCYEYVLNDFNGTLKMGSGDTPNGTLNLTSGNDTNGTLKMGSGRDVKNEVILYKDNTIKNKTNINTNNKDIREKQIQQITKTDLEKVYDNFHDDTETNNDKLNNMIEILVNDFQIRIETAADLVKKAKAKENGLDNLQANINLFLPEKAYLKNLTGRFIAAVKDNFIYQKFSNDDIEDKKRYLKEQENKVIEKYKCIYDLADKSIVKDLTKNNLPNILLNVLFDTKIFFECDYTKDDINYQNSVTMQLSNIPRIDFTNEILRIIEGDKKYLRSSYEFKEMFKDCQNDNEIITKLENKLDYLYF